MNTHTIPQAHPPDITFADLRMQVAPVRMFKATGTEHGSKAADTKHGSKAADT